MTTRALLAMRALAVVATAAICWLALARPASPARLPGALCPVGTTVGVFAHEDDDLLFANPAIAGRIARGACVVTIYLSAGDAGQPAPYWVGREAGSRAAYAAMAGVPDRWVRRARSVGGRQVATFLLRAEPRISLAFLRLPDGLNRGTGFPATGNVSLYQLWNGLIGGIWTVDGVHYTRRDVVRTVRTLALGAHPGQVMTNDFSRSFQCTPESCVRPYDHSDHVAAAYITRAALPELFRAHRVVGAKGYPAVFEDGPNVSGAVLARKAAIFGAYALHDPLVCQGTDVCLADFEYGNFLTRQYLIASPGPG
jgi:hypothetical protein